MRENSSPQTKKTFIRTEQCICSSRFGLFIPNRHMSFLVAGFILLLFFVFIAGYFGGQRQAALLFSEKMEQSSFADQIYSSLCALGDYEVNEQISQASDEPKEIKQEASVLEANHERISTDETSIADLQTMENQSQAHYYAQLIGFGTLQAAQRFVERMQKKNFPVEIRKRKSKTSKGRTISWYQVVSNTYQDKAELDAFLDRIIKEEKLKDVRIISC